MSQNESPIKYRFWYPFPLWVIRYIRETALTRGWKEVSDEAPKFIFVDARTCPKLVRDAKGRPRFSGFSVIALVALSAREWYRRECESVGAKMVKNMPIDKKEAMSLLLAIEESFAE